jgi:LuxR family quorum sensing-dependent transcriptional regulator
VDVSAVHRDVLDFADHIEMVGSAEEVWKAFLAFAARYGLRFGALCDLPGAHERFRDTMICLSWPEGWSERYFEQNYVRRDPAVLQAAETLDPYTWDEILENPVYSKAQRRIVHEATDFRMKSGFVVPIVGFRTGTTFVTVAGTDVDLSSRARAELQLAAVYAHTRIRALAVTKRRPPFVPPLSERERECLSWVATGKSDWEIGEILSISEKTANAHIERAKTKLGVPTRMQAVVMALHAGAIYA